MGVTVRFLAQGQAHEVKCLPTRQHGQKSPHCEAQSASLVDDGPAWSTTPFVLRLGAPALDAACCDTLYIDDGAKTRHALLLVLCAPDHVVALMPDLLDKPGSSNVHV
jgi:hypothetical protein